MTIFGLNFLQKTANRDFVKILRFAVSVFLNFYCGSVLVRFGLDTLIVTYFLEVNCVVGVVGNLLLFVKKKEVLCLVFFLHIRFAN